MLRKRIVLFGFMPIFIFSGLFFYLSFPENKQYIKNEESFKDNINISSIIIKNKEEINSNKDIRILFLGDLMLDRDVREKINKNSLEYILGSLFKKHFFDDYDIISANLEGSVTNGGEHYAPEKKFDFAFLPETVSELKKYNFSFFNLANNHFFDQGSRGEIETRKNLEKAGFSFSGCRDGVIGECSSKIFNLDGKIIGMVGFSVFGSFNIENAKDIITTLKKETDIIIVNVHWGEEYNINQNEKQKDLAYKFIDAGADIIIGHHPHVVQGIEIYKGKVIFFSLGNFIFDQYFSDETQTGLAVEVIFKKEKPIFKLHPLNLKFIRADLMEGDERIAFLKEIANRSFGSDALKIKISFGEL
ncbi:MAG: CapA family protein [Patescibacteria group bacterium]